MIVFKDGTVINHCFCYMTEGETCKREDCSGKGVNKPINELRAAFALDDASPGRVIDGVIFTGKNN